MKKIALFIAAATLMATGAMAQKSLVKDVEKMAGSNDVATLAGALEKITPALTNPETATNAQTWFIAGKAAFGLYDQLQGQKVIGATVDQNMMNQALNSGFEYLQKALPLDSVKETNKDGSFKLDKNGQPKVKTKYSDDIIKMLTGHINDIAGVGNEFLEASDWANAAKAYNKYCEIGTSPFAKKNGIVIADSTLAQVRFFEGYSNYNNKNFTDAFKALSLARQLGYTENQIVEYQTSALANLVQDMIDNKNYAQAYNFIDNALKSDPTNATLYDMKGFTAEIEKGFEAALPFYKQATTTNPSYAQGFFDVGRCLYLRGQEFIEKHTELNTKQLAETLVPLYREALPYLEKAKALDSANTKAGQIIDDINYKMEQMGVK